MSHCLQPGRGCVMWGFGGVKDCQCCCVLCCDNRTPTTTNEEDLTSKFAIGDNEWPGISKLIEEMGELNQVLGKLMGTRGETNHWSGDLWPMLHDEMGDLLAAIQFVTGRCNLDADRIARRAAMKLALFEKWHSGDNDAR